MENGVEGLTANVILNEKTVILTPATGKNPEDLAQKIKNEKLFQKLTPEVPGLYHPKILTEDTQSGRYEVEKATGFNLTVEGGKIQGGGLTDFLKIQTRFKVDAMVTYLKAMAALNSEGYQLQDHKPDSVFIDQIKKNISIVDADSMTKENPILTETWVKSSGLRNILLSFFTRNSDISVYDLVPNGAHIIINELGKKYDTFQKAVIALEGWIQGQKTIEYGPDMSNSPKNHLLLLAGKNDPEMTARINGMNFERANDYELDLLETEINKRRVFRDGIPQSFDTHRLRIK